MAESFTYSKGPKPLPRDVCFSCGREIRKWETGFTATGLCEDCQLEAEEQAERDNAATDEGWDERFHDALERDDQMAMDDLIGEKMREGE